MEIKPSAVIQYRSSYSVLKKLNNGKKKGGIVTAKLYILQCIFLFTGH
jgi:hypothetical protein